MITRRSLLNASAAVLPAKAASLDFHGTMPPKRLTLPIPFGIGLAIWTYLLKMA